jgi:hypothetical protein
MQLSNGSDLFVLPTPRPKFSLLRSPHSQWSKSSPKSLPPPKTRAADATTVILGAAPKDGAAAASHG